MQHLVTLTEAEEGKMYKQGKVISGQKYRDKQRKSDIENNGDDFGRGIGWSR